MKDILILLLAIASLAAEQIDKPYIYSSTGPNSFDCSGLVRYCYLEEADIELPHSAKEIGYLEDYEKIENIDDLTVGDIVCFDTVSDKDLSDHVGIYIGDGNFIHASSGKGKVIQSSLDEEYYNKRFSWGKRIIDSE